MKVKLKVTRSTVDKDGRAIANHEGETIDVPNDEAKRLLESDQAEPVAKKRAERAERR